MKGRCHFCGLPISRALQSPWDTCLVCVGTEACARRERALCKGKDPAIVLEEITGAQAVFCSWANSGAHPGGAGTVGT